MEEQEQPKPVTEVEPATPVATKPVFTPPPAELGPGVVHNQKFLALDKVLEAAKTCASFTELAAKLGVLTGNSVSGSFCERIRLLVPDIKKMLDANKPVPIKSSKPSEFSTLVKPKKSHKKALTEEERLEQEAKKVVKRSHYGPWVKFSTLDLGDRFWVVKNKYAMKWDDKTGWVPLTNEKIAYSPTTKVRRLVGELSNAIRQMGIAADYVPQSNPLDDIKGPGE